jgi:hypothetical protein
VYGAFTLSGQAFQLVLLTFNFFTLPALGRGTVAIKTVPGEPKTFFIGHLCLTTPSYYSSADLFVCKHTKSKKVLALPLSLAATYGIEVSLSSCGYLDVSVHHVPFAYPIDSDMDNRV